MNNQVSVNQSAHESSAPRHRKIMTDYLQALLEGLGDAGVHSVVISPGSRSTPIALLAHACPRFETHVVVDERSAGFFALGIAKATRNPVALICTSGTAAANYYPAICEAYESHIPLVVLTADRPAELQGVGAAQTMNQQDLFGSHVKSSLSIALPEAGDAMLRYAYFQGFRRTQEALQTPRGPVHLNIPLREPLLPILDAPTPKLRRSQVAEKSVCTQRGADDSAIPPALAPYVERQGLLLISGELNLDEAQLWLNLAQHLGWPIIADPLANLAHCGANARPLMRHAELFMPYITAMQDFIPEVILQRGSLPVSKAVNQQIQRWLNHGVPLVFIDESQTWKEQLHCAELVIPGNARTWIEGVMQSGSLRADPHWLEQWEHIEKIAADAVANMPEREGSVAGDSATCAAPALTHSAVVHSIMAAMPDNAQLMIANSNAIRFMDRYESAAESERSFTAFGNRGVNGIDGLISTAAGLAAARPHVPTVLIVGDLAAFHDINGLEIAARYHLPLIVVLLNNCGGGIFRFLPQAGLPSEEYDTIFKTAVNVDFQHTAAMYHARYSQPEELNECMQAFREAVNAMELSIIEIRAQADADVVFLAQLQDRIAEQIAALNPQCSSPRQGSLRNSHA